MFKKLLGIDKIEEEIEEIKKEVLKNKEANVKLWKWIEYLHKKNKLLEEEVNSLKDKNKKLREVLSKLIEKLDLIKANKINYEENLVEEVADVKFSKSDEVILEILYSLAAINKDNCIETSKILENLPFKITPRGLRKKLENLEKIGLIKSIKVGNKKYWYIATENINKLKKRMKEK